jgi:4-amino-4-deoxy-L-arabinose transferase-like glycosyltransferase
MGKHRLAQFPGPPRRALTWLARVVKDRQILTLLGILALGAYLRLWNIQHLFNVLHDYDEGAYSLGARFISQGFLPYQDFLLVHPPLYDLVLASAYKIFGYSFFYGRYLSVALSLACIILIYFIGKRMYHPGAGLAAAALFAVSPMVMYLGRRSVQEILGVFLILVAVYLALDFLDNRKQNRLLLCGLALGLAVATKYLFIPAVLGIIVAVILLSMGEGFWQSFRKLGRPALWLRYVCFAVIFYAFLLLLRWVFGLGVAIPFVDPMYLTAGDVMVTIFVFVIPFFISLALEKKWPSKEWWLELWSLRGNKGLWMLVGGAVLGFICVTGFFWIKMPQEFVYQTVLLQQSRSLAEFPSFVGLIRLVPLNTGFLRMVCLTVLLIIPFIFIILNKNSFSKSDCFLAVVLVVSFVLCQGFAAMPRYYICLYPFLFLGISWLVPPMNMKLLSERLKAGLLVVLSILLFFLSLSFVLLSNYTGYDTMLPGPVFASNEESMYRETLDFLEGAGAKKIYATSPSFPAMSSDLESSLSFDIFALLWLQKKPVEEIVKDWIDEGVDYVLLDEWIRYWGGPKREQAVELAQQVRRNSRLVKVVEPDSALMVEIYRLGEEAQGVFNGDFAQWVIDRGVRLPLGWDPVLIRGGDDLADIGEAYVAGKNCVRLTIYEDGEKDDNRDSTHAGISQKMLFPRGRIRVQILPEFNTAAIGRTELVSGIHFIDAVGHSLIVGFSDEVDGEEILRYEDDYRMLVVKEAQLEQWSEHIMDLPAYWNHAGWQQPAEVTVLLVVSSYYTNPGYYTFCVAEVEMEDI